MRQEHLDRPWVRGDAGPRRQREAGPVPPTFPRVPGVRRRRRRRPQVLTALCAGLVGGVVAILLAPVLSRTVAPPTAATPVSSPAPPGNDPQEQIARGTVARVAHSVVPSVVRINRGAGGPLDGTGNGSGVVYRPDGLIVTNNHVVQDADGLEVVFSDGEVARARVVGTDPYNDLAVIRVDRSGLDAIEIGRTRSLQVGDLAVAVGSPFGLDATVTVGVVSALGRGVHAGAAEGASVYLPEVIQTDAPINPGNSGGALVDRNGRLIGINSAILTAGEPANAGVGFAIPVDTVVDVADKLITDGRVRHPLLGVSGGPVGPEAARRLGVESGAWVHEVVPGSPASVAGLARDDVIVAVDDRPVESMEDLSIVVRDHEVGDRVTVTFMRDGNRRTVDVVLGERDADGAQ